MPVGPRLAHELQTYVTRRRQLPVHRQKGSGLNTHNFFHERRVLQGFIGAQRYSQAGVDLPRSLFDTILAEAGIEFEM